MRKYLFLLFSCWLGLGLSAAPISQQEALRLAQAYLQQNNALLSVSPQQLPALSLAYQCLPKNSRSAGDAHPLFYVFDRGANDGFIVISGDDRVQPVWACVEQGKFNYQEAHPGLKWWLQTLESTMTRELTEKQKTSASHLSSASGNFAPAVAPLVKTQWNQEGPYNNVCPMDPKTGERSLVGCVAVSIGQILYYWQSVDRAQGTSIYYDSQAQSHEVDLSQYTFDWDNMLEVYDGDETAEQNKAVSEFLYVCGVATEMQYSSEFSGTNLYDFCLEEHFGIDERCNSVFRDFYSVEEWDALIKTELNAGRPVSYAGFSDLGGHQFVCDGYNESGLFHINWGWGGACDGYFELSNLNPDELGSEFGSDGKSGFHCAQSITYAIQPKEVSVALPEDQPCFYHEVWTESTKMQLGDVFNVTVSQVGCDDNTSAALFGFGYVSSDGVFHNLANYLYGTDQFYTFEHLYDFEMEIALPKELKDGIYYLQPGYYRGFEVDEMPPFQSMRPRLGINNRKTVTLEVKGQQVTVLDDSQNYKSRLKVLDGSFVALDSISVAGKINAFQFTVRNDGALYSGPLYVVRKGTSTDKRLAYVPCILNPGEQKDFLIEVKSAAGVNVDSLEVWSVGYAYDVYLSNQELEKVGEFACDLVITPDSPAKLTASGITFRDPLLIGDAPLAFDVTVTNTGGVFKDCIYFGFYTKDKVEAVGYRPSSEIQLNTGESRHLTFEFDVKDLEANQYLLLPYAAVDNQASFIFEQPFSELTFAQTGLTGKGDFVRFSTSLSEGTEHLYVSPAQTDAFCPVSAGIASSVENLFYYVDGHLLSYANGQYLTANDASAVGFHSVGDAGKTFELALSEEESLATYYLTLDEGKSFVHTASGKVSAVTTPSRDCAFFLEKANALPVSIGASRYASFCAPVALSLPAGLEAYIGQKAGDVFRLYPLADVIPAHTPVILVGDAGTYDLAITPSSATSGVNDLVGTLESVACPEKGAYTLQQLQGCVGLYRYVGAYLKGFKAYLPVDKAETNGYRLEWGEVTGVETVGQDHQRVTYYDLNGRRVYYPTHGVYVTGDGRKIFVR